MATVSVIYRPPKGESKVLEWGEFTFLYGVPVEIEDNELNAHMIKKISGNSHFELSEMGTVNKSAAPPKNPEPAPEPEPEPDPPHVPEEQTEAGPAPTIFEDYKPEPPKPPKAVPARAKHARAKTSKERVTSRRKRAGW